MEIIAQILDKRPRKHGLVQLSVSKTKAFSDCKAKFHFQYIQKLPKKSRDYLTLGKFVHQILEYFYLEKIKGNTDSDNKLMTECFKKSLESYKDRLTSEQKEESFKILKWYLEKLHIQRKNNKLPKPLDVEQEFNICIDNKILVIGYIDRVQIDHDGVLHVVDYKTSKPSSKKYLKKDLFQLKTYAYVLCLINPNIEKVRGSYLLLKDECNSLEFEFTRKEAMKMANKFVQYAKKIENEKLFRPSTGPLCDYCDFLEYCAQGKEYTTVEVNSGEVDWI